MKAIVAVNNLFYIGKDNILLWSCSDDLKHFKNLTMGSKLLVGYNTSLTLPRLKNREMFIDERGVCSFNLNSSKKDNCFSLASLIVFCISVSSGSLISSGLPENGLIVPSSANSETGSTGPKSSSSSKIFSCMS
jgi:hypothetical protein